MQPILLLRINLNMMELNDRPLQVSQEFKLGAQHASWDAVGLAGLGWTGLLWLDWLDEGDMN